MPPASIADETRRHCTEPVKPHFVAPSEQIFELRHRAIHQSRAQPALTGVLVFCLEASVTRSALLLRLTRLRDFRLRDFLFEISCRDFLDTIIRPWYTNARRSAGPLFISA